jgi:hypothetical protein
MTRLLKEVITGTINTQLTMVENIIARYWCFFPSRKIEKKSVTTIPANAPAITSTGATLFRESTALYQKFKNNIIKSP